MVKKLDKLEMPAPKMDEEMDLMEMDMEEEPDMEEEASPLADVEDDVLLEEVKKRGLSLDEEPEMVEEDLAMAEEDMAL